MTQKDLQIAPYDTVYYFTRLLYFESECHQIQLQMQLNASIIFCCSSKLGPLLGNFEIFVQVWPNDPKMPENRPAGYLRSFLFNPYNQMQLQVPVNIRIDFLIRNCLQISLLILSKFKQINKLLFALKSSENLWLSDDFRGDRC